MRESGIITEIEEHTMMVEFERSSMCEKCGACERAHNAMRMEVERIGNASLGDRVEVDLPERTVVRAALVAYGIPLALLLAGLAAGSALPGRLGLPGNPDLYALALGLLLAAGAFLALHLSERRRRSSGRYAPKVVQIERLCQQCGASRENNRERQDANHGNEIGQHEL